MKFIRVTGNAWQKFGFGLMVLSVVIAWGTRYANPDKASTRLLIDHWPAFVLSVILYAVGFTLYLDKKNRKA